MIQKHQNKTENSKNFLEKDKKMLPRSASSNFFKFIWLEEGYLNILKPLKSHQKKESKKEKELKQEKELHQKKESHQKQDAQKNYQQEFFKNDLPLYDIEDGALFDDSADEAEDPPYLKKFYEEIEIKRKHTNALYIFRDKANNKIKSYSTELSNEQKILQYAKQSFISEVGTYPEKYKKCSIAYNDFKKELKGPIQTRYELLSLTYDLINKLNYRTGWSCVTGFDLMNAALKEVGLPKLTSEEKDSIKQGIIPCDEDHDDSFYPIII